MDDVMFARGGGWFLRSSLIVTFLAICNLAFAESLIVSGGRMSRYWCEKLGGSANSESACSVKYHPYPGNACAIFEASEQERPSPFVTDAMGRAQGCRPVALTKLKEDTVHMRVDLMSGVKLGSDETINDPLHSPDREWINRLVRIDQVAQSYFGWECAISRCSRGAASASRPSPQDSMGSRTKQAGQVPNPKRPKGSQAGDRGAAHKEATLRVCNAGSVSMEVAFAWSKFVPISGTKSLGELLAWYVVRPGECRDLFNNRWTANSYAAPNWLHARATGQVVWPKVADINFCLSDATINGRPVDVVTGDLSCATGERLERFGRIDVSPPSHVLTLHPGS